MKDIFNISVEKLISDFDSIPQERKEKLLGVAAYIKDKLVSGGTAKLIFICTHNSRRSHLAQIWAQAAAEYYGVSNIECYSGGTEATAFNANAVSALQRAGFEIEKMSGENNPVYSVKYSDGKEPLKCFSKVFSDKENPQKDFAAVMTCSQADEACPVVPGAEKRFSISYEDPKKFDGTPQEKEKYDERCRQIGTEMFYLLSLTKES